MPKGGLLGLKCHDICIFDRVSFHAKAKQATAYSCVVDTSSDHAKPALRVSICSRDARPRKMSYPGLDRSLSLISIPCLTVKLTRLAPASKKPHPPPWKLTKPTGRNEVRFPQRSQVPGIPTHFLWDFPRSQAGNLSWRSGAKMTVDSKVLDLIPLFITSTSCRNTRPADLHPCSAGKCSTPHIPDLYCHL